MCVGERMTWKIKEGRNREDYQVWKGNDGKKERRRNGRIYCTGRRIPIKR